MTLQKKTSDKRHPGIMPDQTIGFDLSAEYAAAGKLSGK
jgi:hypothetical protein